MRAYELTIEQRTIAVTTWNKRPGDFAAVVDATGRTLRDVRRYLSSRKGFPGVIGKDVPATKLTSAQAAHPPAPVTLRPLAFLSPERRLPWENCR